MFEAKRQHILRVFVTVDIRKPANEGKKLLTSGDAARSSHSLELLFFNEQVANLEIETARIIKQ